MRRYDDRRRSPPRRRDRSRDRDRDRDRGNSASRGGGGFSHRSEEQAKLREMLLKEAAQRNPDAANVFSGNSAAIDQDAMQRALLTASSLGVTHAQNAQHLAQQQQHRTSNAGNAPRAPRMSHGSGGGGRSNPFEGSTPEKIFYELHIGSLPETVQDEVFLASFLNEEIARRGLNLQPGNPITSTRINSVGHFAFALFRSKEEATRGLELNGVVCHGVALRMERPRGFKLGNSGAPVPQMDEAQIINAVLSTTPVANVAGYTREELRRALEEDLARLGDSTSLVELGNLANASLDEVSSEARLFGSVVGVKQRADGVFLVKMSNLHDAEQLVQMKREYNGVRVSTRFRHLSEWEETV